MTLSKKLFKTCRLARGKGAVKILQDRGLHLRGLKKKNFELINEYLNEFKPEFKAIGVDMVGWQDDNEAYMLPFANEPIV